MRGPGKSRDENENPGEHKLSVAAFAKNDWVRDTEVGTSRHVE